MDYMKTKDVCEIKEKLVSCLKSHIDCGTENIDTDEAKKCAEIIGNLADVEKDYYETEYYKKVVEAMEESDDRYGYNNRRYMNGRYAPKGRGSVMGYRPYIDQEPYIDGYINDPNFADNMRMGYSGMMEGGDGHSRYGMSYDRYKTARRHYTETNDEASKHKMNDHINEHLNDSIVTLKEMWKDADSYLRSRMKEDLMALVNQMN